MRTITVMLFSLSLGIQGYGSTTQAAGQGRLPNKADEAHLTRRIQHFEITDAGLVDGIASLSLDQAAELHLGVEEILRDKLSNPTDRTVHFSLRLENKSVREILDTLCQFDSRYAWSTDGPSINIYPRGTIDDPSYLLNYTLEEITLEEIADPDKVFVLLHRQLPKEQLAYIQMGGDISYAKPWTSVFDHLTVRQLINRVAEHLGARSAWIFHGSKNERLFTFQKGGFHTDIGN
jgi:hypothetical protein